MKDQENTGPNWRAFGQILFLGRLRILGIEPTPQEVKDRLKREEVDRKKAG